MDRVCAQALGPSIETALGPTAEAALVPTAEEAQADCPVTVDYEAKLLQGSANGSAVPFVGSISIQNDSPSVRSPSYLIEEKCAFAT